MIEEGTMRDQMSISSAYNPKEQPVKFAHQNRLLKVDTIANMNKSNKVRSKTVTLLEQSPMPKNKA